MQPAPPSQPHLYMTKIAFLHRNVVTFVGLGKQMDIYVSTGEALTCSNALLNECQTISTLYHAVVSPC